MAWYETAVFYHIYPLGLTGAPRENDYGAPVSRLLNLLPWIEHIRKIGCSALYIGPLFESVGHGYETTDYRKVDTRLGVNADLRRFVDACHASGVRVILDGVFNHTGRDFFAFRDLKQNREASPYRDWYRRVDFSGNNEYNDGFSYENWGGYNLLAKLNLQNHQVRDYLMDTVRFWVDAFDIDGLRLDAADVMDFEFMRALRDEARALKPDFWLMGEVIHGDYGRWANDSVLNAVTNYHLHKALYSAHNDHNYFEIAHTVRRQLDAGLGGGQLYNFADNHDVDRIMSKLNCKAHFLPVHVLLYTLPGVPSLYYGSEFGVEGRKDRGSDAPLRPCLDLKQFEGKPNACLEIVTALGKVHAAEKALWYGAYRELKLTTGQYAFLRGDVAVTVNNADGPAAFELPLNGDYRGALTGAKAQSENGVLRVEIGPNGGEIWIPEGQDRPEYAPLRLSVLSAPSAQPAMPRRAAPGKPYEAMTVEELQAEILAKLRANGPLTDQMKRDVQNNVYRDSLLNWVRSFR